MDAANAPLKKELTSNVLIGLVSITLASVSLFLVISYCMNRLSNANKLVQKLSAGDGDLTIQLDASGRDEVSDLSKNVNIFVHKLHTIVSEVVQSSHQVGEKSGKLQDVARQTKLNVTSQKDEVSLIATAANQMSATAQEVANNAETTAAATAESLEKCSDSVEVINQNKKSISGLAEEISLTAQAMSELEANTQNINNILVAIQGIAEQTNLLALNAAIEAARAGEQGRGFAVVADEVRVLSQRTQNSTEEIRSMIETLLANTNEAVQTMSRSKSLTDESVQQANKAVESLEDISASVKTIADMSTQIASAAEEQRAVTEELNRNTQSVKNSSDEMLTAADTTVQMSVELKEVYNSLNDQVGLFKL